MNTVVGKKHQDMLKLPPGHACDTYRNLCENLGLLQDVGKWVEVLTESATTIF